MAVINISRNRPAATLITLASAVGVGGAPLVVLSVGTMKLALTVRVLSGCIGRKLSTRVLLLVSLSMRSMSICYREERTSYIESRVLKARPIVCKITHWMHCRSNPFSYPELLVLFVPLQDEDSRDVNESFSFTKLHDVTLVLDNHFRQSF